MLITDYALNPFLQKWFHRPLHRLRIYKKYLGKLLTTGVI
jgi:hypothetical protein